MQVNRTQLKEVGTVLIGVEFTHISPQVVQNYTGTGYSVYLLPHRGDKVYTLKSDGKTITVSLVTRSSMIEADSITVGCTQCEIRAGQTLVLSMNSGKQKVYPEMAVIYATRGIYWTSRMQALKEMELIKKARKR